MEARAEVLVAPEHRGRSSLETAAWVVVLAAALGLVVYLSHVLLLLFAGILVGVLLDALAGRVQRWTRLGHGAALALVTLVFAALGVGAGLLIVPKLVEQVSSLVERLPAAWSSAWDRVVSGRAQVQQAVEQVDPSLVAPVVRSVSATLAIAAEAAIILAIGIYAAARPGLYVDGFVRLLPHDWRDAAREVLHEAGHQLRRWMLGAILEMTSAGVLIGVGLWLLGVPYSLGLGLLAGLLELVPNFGPVAAAIPAVLITVAGENDASWWHVGVMYMIVQTFQSYVVQPLIQQHMVEIPPVLLIITLVAMGWGLGALALFTAVPLLVVVMVAVKLLYQRDVLGERVQGAAM